MNVAKAALTVFNIPFAASECQCFIGLRLQEKNALSMSRNSACLRSHEWAGSFSSSAKKRTFGDVIGGTLG